MYPLKVYLRHCPWTVEVGVHCLLGWGHPNSFFIWTTPWLTLLLLLLFCGFSSGQSVPTKERQRIGKGDATGVTRVLPLSSKLGHSRVQSRNLLSYDGVRWQSLLQSVVGSPRPLHRQYTGTSLGTPIRPTSRLIDTGLSSEGESLPTSTGVVLLNEILRFSC